MPLNIFLWLSERRSVFNFVKSNGLARKLASRFVAGETVDSAVQAAKVLNKDGTMVSLDLLGESVSSREETEAARDEVLEILDAITNEGVDGNVSVKLTQLGLDIDRQLCLDNMGQILTRATELDTFVRIDMESTEYTERTMEIFRDLYGEFGTITGLVIQCYLRRSANDIEELIKLGARVRLCKGAYAEPADLAFQDMEEIRQSFIQLMTRLLQDGNYPAIATHDDSLVDWALQHVKENNISKDKFEFQMLYGVRRDLQQKLRGLGYNVRVYIPFGSNWYPYLMRRMAERSSNVGFMVRSLMKEMFSRK